MTFGPSLFAAATIHEPALRSDEYFHPYFWNIAKPETQSAQSNSVNWVAGRRGKEPQSRCSGGWDEQIT